MTGQAASVYINHLLSARHWVLIPGPEMPPCAALASGLGWAVLPTLPLLPHHTLPQPWEPTTLVLQVRRGLKEHNVHPAPPPPAVSPGTFQLLLTPPRSARRLISSPAALPALL